MLWLPQRMTWDWPSFNPRLNRTDLPYGLEIPSRYDPVLGWADKISFFTQTITWCPIRTRRMPKHPDQSFRKSGDLGSDLEAYYWGSLPTRRLKTMLLVIRTAAACDCQPRSTIGSRGGWVVFFDSTIRSHRFAERRTRGKSDVMSTFVSQQFGVTFREGVYVKQRFNQNLPRILGRTRPWSTVHLFQPLYPCQLHSA